MGRAVSLCALFVWMVVAWLLMLEFRDQLPNPLLSQRERLPGMQKMGRKEKKKAITLEMVCVGGSPPAETSLPRRVTAVGRGPRAVHGSTGDNPKAGCSLRLSLQGSSSHQPPAQLLTTNCRLLVFLGALWLLIRKRGAGRQPPSIHPAGICFSQSNAAAESLSCELSPIRDSNPGKWGQGNDLAEI